MPIHVDPKLARGLTMAEVRPILRAPAGSASGSLRDVTNPVRRAFKPVAWRYETARLPDARYVSELARTVDALFERDPGTVARKAEELPGQPALPWFFRSYLSMAPKTAGEDARSLVASTTTVMIDDGQVSLCQARIMEVGLHVVERFHQRTRSGLLRDALGSIGRAVLPELGFLHLMLDVMGKRAGKTIVLPFADGLIIGDAQRLSARECSPYGVIQYIGVSPILVQDRAVVPVAGVERQDWQGADGYGFKAATFIGPREMHPRQVRLRDALLRVASDHARILSHLGDTMTAPGKVQANTSEEEAPRLIREMRAAYRDMGALLDDPVHRGALSRTREEVEPSVEEVEPEVGFRP